MTFESCSFETSRLLVREWSMSSAPKPEPDLADVVTTLLTEPITRSLPPEWQGPYSRDRAVQWIADRDNEGPTLLVVDRATDQAVGLLLLFESVAEDGKGTDVRLGYVLAESAWGRGLASELIEGFVRWCRTRSDIRSLAGGVERTNLASRRVLEKSGFVPVEDETDDSDANVIFELRDLRVE